MFFDTEEEAIKEFNEIIKDCINNNLHLNYLNEFFIGKITHEVLKNYTIERIARCVYTQLLKKKKY